jgi:hypothetical protein
MRRILCLWSVKEPLNSMHQSKQLLKQYASGGKTKHTNIAFLNRTKIDLTKYTEKHTFTFDDAFDSHTSNTDVIYYT